MQLKLVRGCGLGHTRLKPKGVTVQREKLLSAAIFIAKIRDSNPDKHEYRLMYAKKIRDAIDAFIDEEVHEANSKPIKSPEHLSWAKIGEIMGLSRSAAFTKYGKKENERAIHEPARND